MRIGPIELASPFCQAGLAGYSDRAMRLVARRRGCPYAVTEALLDVIMLNGGEGLRRSIDLNDEDHPLAGQIMGSEPETMSRAARIIHQAGYDVVDLNFACPVKKIKNKARGGHMLLDVPRGLSILHAVRDAVPDGTLTMSLRRGFDDSAESEDRFFHIVEAAWELGFAAIRVHGRTVDQKYAGRASWPFLRDLKRRYPGKTILGSGDVFTAEDAVRMLRETGVDIVWIARGAIGNPWIFRQAQHLLKSDLVGSALPTISALEDRLSQSGTVRRADPTSLQDAHLARREHTPGMPQGRTPFAGKAGPACVHAALNEDVEEWSPPTIAEQRDALAEHFAIAMEIHGESLAGCRMRKMGIKYSRFHPMSAEVKKAFIAVHSLRDWTNVLGKWYSVDGPGVWPEAGAADEVNGEVQGCEIG